MDKEKLADIFWGLEDRINRNFDWDVFNGYNPLINPLNWVTDVLSRLGCYVRDGYA